jgi:uncharacterized membrane protein
MGTHENKMKAIEKGLEWLIDMADSKRGEAIRVFESDPDVTAKCSVVFGYANLTVHATKIAQRLAQRLFIIIDELSASQIEMFPEEHDETIAEYQLKIGLLDKAIMDTENWEQPDMDKPKNDKPPTKKTPARNVNGQTKVKKKKDKLKTSPTDGGVPFDP